MFSVRHLKILQWNINGIRSKREELMQIIKESGIFIGCLQETLLEDKDWKPPRDYNIERSSHIAGEGHRGVATLVHKSQNYQRQNINTTLEVVAITIYAPNPLTICNVYCSPNKELRHSDLTEIVYQLHRPYLLLGDFNEKNQLWEIDLPTDSRERTIEILLIEEQLVCLNNGSKMHHHIQSNLESAINLSISTLDLETELE